MADALSPGKSGDQGARRGDRGNQQGKMAKLATGEQSRAGIKSGESEGHNPTQEKLNVTCVDGHGIPAEGQQIPEGGMDPNAIFKPERKCAEQQENRNVNDSAAGAEEGEKKYVGYIPMDVHAYGHPDDDPEAAEGLKERFQAKIFKQYLKERADRAQQDAVKFSFHNLRVAEFVEIQAQDVEQTKGNQRKAIEKNDLLKRPSRQVHLPEQDQDKRECKSRGGGACGQADQEVAAVAHSDFQVLDEIIPEQAQVEARVGKCPFHSLSRHEW